MSLRAHLVAATSLVFLAGCGPAWESSWNTWDGKDPDPTKNPVRLPPVWAGGCATKPDPENGCSQYLFRWPLTPPDKQGKRDKVAAGYGPRWLAKETRYDFHPGLDLLPAGDAFDPPILPDNGDGLLKQDGVPVFPAIHAVADGVVDSRKMESSGLGYWVRLKHQIVPKALEEQGAWSRENTYYTVYGHMNDFCQKEAHADCAPRTDDIQEKQVVKAGQVIGHVGKTGNAKTQHLHFEVQGHPWQFYSVNPLRYLDHPEGNDYKPEVLAALPGTTKCTAPFSVTNPRFWVKYQATPDELDVDSITVVLRDPTNNAIIGVKSVQYEKRRGVGAFLDTPFIQQAPAPTEPPDGFITRTALANQHCDNPVANVEYYPDCRQSGPTPIPGPEWNVTAGITPIFDDCGGPVRNVFTHGSTLLTIEVQFDHLGPIFEYKAEDGTKKTRTEVQVLADVCDIAGHCKSTTASLATGAK